MCILSVCGVGGEWPCGGSLKIPDVHMGPKRLATPAATLEIMERTLPASVGGGLSEWAFLLQRGHHNLSILFIGCEIPLKLEWEGNRSYSRRAQPSHLSHSLLWQASVARPSVAWLVCARNNSSLPMAGNQSHQKDFRRAMLNHTKSLPGPVYCFPLWPARSFQEACKGRHEGNNFSLLVFFASNAM